MTTVLSATERVITIDAIDAFDSTPVLDVKPLVQRDKPREELRFPSWVNNEK